MLVEAAWRATWPHDRLVLGASRLIREADSWVPGKRIPVHSNRGLAGIDGTISTAIGMALGTETEGTTRVLLGDLAALHDAGGMSFGVGEPRPRIQVIVGNDGGGTIFDGLEVAATAPQDALDRVLLTPQSVDFAALAAAYGWTYIRATNRGELDQALTASVAPTLIEVPLPR
jgi:2-succinyl-5-enolpyruvyl-6-hydroxy-3-cyclohexene-1-carboxylate synthase